MSLLERARASGRCPPSLLQEQVSKDSLAAFEGAVTKVLDASGTLSAVTVRMVGTATVWLSGRCTAFETILVLMIMLD